MVETLDLQDEMGSLGATNIFVPPPPEQSQQPQQPAVPPPEKNIPKQQSTPMDSTPIEDIMEPQQPQMVPQVQIQPQAVVQPQPQVQPQVQAPPTKGKNAFNLTDEQMEALIAAAVAMVSISGPVQDKLAGIVPNFLEESGARSMTGMAVTAAVVAIMFFFVRRFMNKQ